MSAAPGAAPCLIRDAAEADFDRIAEIYRHHVLNGFGTFDEEAPAAAAMRARFLELRALDLPWLVAASGGNLLGYAYAAPYRPRSAYRFTLEDSIYVAPDWLRRGVATRLLDALIRRCAAAGTRQLVAVIGDSDNTASIGLHEKCGFRRAGVLRDVGFKAGRVLDTVIMQRAVTGRNGTAA
ncbi:MAG: GNAT family N-acetyltransferase [Stellaceae bacterium]